jgi:protein tyrosine phosphatase
MLTYCLQMKMLRNSITAYIAYQAQRMKTYREFLSLILKDLLLVTIILYLEANKSLDREHVLLLLSP